MTSAKLFQHGDSQAVCLPRAFSFDCTEVEIEKRGGEVVLRPKSAPETTSSRWVKEIPTNWDKYKFDVSRDYCGRGMEEVFPLFRGQARKGWRLQSPWDRWLHDQGISWDDGRSLLETVLETFKELASGLPGVESLKDGEDNDWWALGRHYGLLTPLLDWTRSPYVAAFFAFTDYLHSAMTGYKDQGRFDHKQWMELDKAEPIVVWAFMRGKSREAGGVEVVNPRIDLAHRQRAQQGLFTRLDGWQDIEEYLESLSLNRPILLKYLIPGEEALRAVTELRLMNIMFSTLYPDLQGAVWQSNFELPSEYGKLANILQEAGKAPRSRRRPPTATPEGLHSSPARTPKRSRPGAGRNRPRRSGDAE